MNGIVIAHNHCQERFPDALIIVRDGDEYVSLHKDMAKISTVTPIEIGYKGIKGCFRFQECIDIFLPRLVRNGYRVGICEKYDNQQFS